MIAALHLMCLLMAGINAALLRQVDAVLESAMVHQHVPGISVGLAMDGHVMYARGYGYRIVPKQLPASGHTAYNIASTTKQFTASAIMVLQQRGLLNVDDRLSKYYPRYKYAGRVTLRQLLTHTSGIPDYLDQPNVASNATAAQQIATIAKLPPAFTPGSRFEYSNSNYVILGLIVEKLTHLSLQTVFKQWFFQPLTMLDSTSVALPWSLPGGAMGYAYKGGRFVAIPQTVAQYGYGDGAIDSSAYDLMLWDQGLIGLRVVDADSWREMMTPPSAQGEPLPGGYAFGLQSQTLFGHREIEHGGDNEGFHNDNAVFPDDKFSLAILGNGNDFFSDYLLVKLFSLFYPPTPEQQAAFDAGVPGDDPAIRSKALDLLHRMQAGSAKKSEVMVPEIAAQIAGTPQQMASRAGAVGQLTKAVFRGMSYRSGNRIYEYWLFYPRSVVAYLYVLTPRGKIYAALPVRAD